MRSALDWARVRTLAADGLSQREIARRLGINRRTVARLVASEEPPSYRRATAGSQLDPLEPVPELDEDFEFPDFMPEEWGDLEGEEPRG